MTPMLVAAALSNREWRAALQRQVRDHESDIVVELVRDRHQAMADAVDLVIVDDDTSWISWPVVTALGDAGKRVVGVFDPAEGDGYGEKFLRDHGIDLVVPSDLPTDVLIDFLRQHRPDRHQLLSDADLLQPLDDVVPPSERRILAVGGPSGAGVTEVSIGLAQLLARDRTVLVDSDENHPGISRRLGLNIHPHIVTAVDIARRGRSDFESEIDPIESCLAQPALTSGTLPFDVIAGLASRDDWSLLRADDTVALLDVLSTKWANVVAKVGSNLDELPGIPRYEVSRQVLKRAERIVAVTQGSPTGLLHFVDWLVEAVPLAGDAPIDVVVNKAPSSPALRGQIETELLNITGDRVASIVFAPSDRRIERAAWDAELAPRGSFLRSLRPLAGLPPARFRRRLSSDLPQPEAA